MSLSRSLWTPEFDHFTEPARRRAGLGWLVLGCVLVIGIYAASLMGIFGAIGLIGGEGAAAQWLLRVQTAAGPTATLLLLATFGGLVLGLWACLRLVHRRPLGSVIGAREQTARDFRRASVITLAGMGLSLLLFLPGMEILPNLPLGIWVSFLPLALLMIALQTGAEEMLFRGYLQQQLAARFSSPLVWMLLPSALFGAAHYDPTTAGDTALQVALAAGIFGLMAADLTRLTGNIGAAWGMHFANNCMAILGVSVQGTIPGLSLYTTELAISDTAEISVLLWQDMALTLLFYLAIRWVVTR
ncbi:abortive infection protein [Dinoroseobacter shibae DFL 12 = DSM 16493]|jgi:membrane protease YdiL (CAAX protease family)|uniref:Abortive infection protein n=1 Tax=Dinoroseobacter shibae (strain DSM 16493 / NCIMB 14021 / DFL 12) TaxID=398580 RepID=A8LKN6_DINSH|nr:type II CAAX endopeptidase family protein [Dinoroseobacter shibae]ABV91879.1 abortive infection protein [Dinoroseobacter shibae DFL 12 = DSM 16493]URF46857.1 CPBP family intramembrane metalloprotease [Dinoroseobacter shibae]URF51168.1 CPBP family intramembrane metalloprotease [Dinoroseobacter shibae]